jgi:predicted molibdopterin-dependent oxidoreductase YjgC
MLTGNIGKESTGVNPLRGHNNVQGACDVGCLPIYLPGYQKVDDASVRTKFESAWGVKLPEKPGLTMVEMINACGKEIKALYIMGENPMLSDPDINHVRETLKKLELFVVQDMFITETSELADVVLPSASFAERDGTYTNTERRVQRIRKAIEPMGESRPDWEIICQVASKLGYEMHYDSPKEIMDEIASLTPIYGGIAYDRLDFEGLQWPCPNKEHPGTKYLHKEKFSRGLGKFVPIEYKPPAEETDKEYPMILTTGRTLFHFHTGTLTRRSPTLNELLSEGYVEVNPTDAEKLEISEGEMVKVKSRRGEIVIKARVSEVVPKGVVFIPFHFREAAANALTNAALDPVAKIPEYKVCAVRLAKA